jgi:hypothetical protein
MGDGRRRTFRLWRAYQISDRSPTADAQVTFTRDRTGAVTGLVIHQNNEDRAATKVK